MLAPIDARAEVEAVGERIVLRLNFRTLALAKAAGVNLLAVSLTEIDPLDMALVVEAFAKPEQPQFDAEQAFALICINPEGCREALVSLSGAFASAMEGGKPNPPKPGTKPKRSTS